MKTNKNNQAFPDVGNPGMTIREYFAAQALNGLLMNSAAYTSEALATVAVTAADALIEALNKKEGE